MKYKELQAVDNFAKQPNKDLDSNESTHLLKGEDQEPVVMSVQSTKSVEDLEDQAVSLPLMNLKP